MRTACSAWVHSKYLPSRLARRFFERVARIIQSTQRRLAAARRSHHKRTVRHLHAKKIRLNRLHRCRWGPDS